MLNRRGIGSVVACGLAVLGAARLAGQAYTFSQYTGAALGPGGSGIPGLSASTLAFDTAGNIYLDDANGGTIRKVSPTGTMTLSAGSVAGYVDGVGAAVRFTRPALAGFDANGNLLVYDGGAGVLRQIAPNGLVTTRLRVNPPSGMPSPLVALDGAGNIYIGDTNTSVIRKVAADGTVTNVPATGSVSFGSFIYGLAADDAGNVFVAVSDSTIQRIAADGTLSVWAGTSRVQGSTDGPRASALFNVPGAMAFDASGNLYVADLGNDTIRRISPTGDVTTVAGSVGVAGAADGAGTAAQLGHPMALTRDPSGRIVFLDYATESIRTLTPATRIVTTLVTGLNAADGPLATAFFSSPAHLAADPAGNLYVAGTNPAMIRKVSTAGVVSTLAGVPMGSGLPVAPGQPQLEYPAGLTPDGAGGVYLADYGASTIDHLSVQGALSVVAGTAHVTGVADGAGPAAQFNHPAGVTRDAAGNLFVSDSLNYAIRKIAPDGTVSLFAGAMGVTGALDGTGSAALFKNPGGIAADTAGNVYVADNFAIRKITPGRVVTTLAGTLGVSGSADGSGAAARFGGSGSFSGLGDIAVDAAGNIFVADTGSRTLRKVSPAGVVTTIGGLPGAGGTVSGTGSAARFAGPSGVAVDPAGNVYVTQNTSGDATIRIGVPTNSAPTFSMGPATEAVTPGATVVLTANATAAATYQWYRNGTAVAGATQSTLAMTNASAAAQAGTYTLVATNAMGTGTSAPATLTVAAAANPGHFLNLSVLAATSAAQPLTVGFVNGQGAGGSEPLLIRGLGPALVPFGVADHVLDPVLDLYLQSSGAVIATNDNWAGDASVAAANAAFTGLPLTDAAGFDAATVVTLPSAAYTVRVTGKGGAAGRVLAEVYDANPSYTAAATRLINLSTRDAIAMNGSLTIGFVIGGDTARTVLVRVSGPALASFGVTDAMPDPQLALYQGASVLFRNAGWGGDALISSTAAAVSAFPISDTTSHDAALVTTLPPGSYTVEATSASGSPGSAIIEVYEVP